MQRLKNGTFGIFPAEVCKGLSPFQQTLFAWLCYRTDGANKCFPSQKRLAEECGMSKSAVNKHLDELEKKELIKRTQRQKKDSNEKDSTLYEVLIGSPSERVPTPPQGVPSTLESVDVLHQRDSNQKQLNQNQEPKKEKFIPPSLEEVKSYFSEKGELTKEAELFFNYYESNGWMVGKNKMRKWKAAANNWITKKNAHSGSLGGNF